MAWNIRRKVIQNPLSFFFQVSFDIYWILANWSEVIFLLVGYYIFKD